MKKHFFLIIALCAAFATSGCATRLSANVNPKADVNDLGRIYVARFAPDQRNLHKIFAEELNALGQKATAGEPEDQPKNTNTLITYSDRWMWDVTMYMIALDVQVFDVKKGTQIATVHNMRTSLARKTPRGMIRGALYEFFGKENPDDLPENQPKHTTGRHD